MSVPVATGVGCGASIGDVGADGADGDNSSIPSSLLSLIAVVGPPVDGVTIGAPLADGKGVLGPAVLGMGILEGTRALGPELVGVIVDGGDEASLSSGVSLLLSESASIASKRIS